MVLLDSDGIIGPDGKAITTTSNASLAPSHDPSQLLFFFDTGFSLPQVPAYIASAFYSGAKGAKLTNVSESAADGNVWVVDCTAEINVTFKIAGQSYPVHPLDVTRVADEVDANGNKICYGTFQPVTTGALDYTRDGILGMTFLSNVYLLLDYGNFTEADPAAANSPPYVQILSTTDPAKAHADFVATRLSG
jgi:hypothetical protein